MATPFVRGAKGELQRALFRVQEVEQELQRHRDTELRCRRRATTPVAAKQRVILSLYVKRKRARKPL